MKRLAFLFGIVLLFSACARPAVDAHGCYRDMDSALAASKKNGHNIVVIATMDGDDEQSSAFIKRVVGTEDFVNVTSQFSVVHMDFSKKTYDSTVAENEEDKKAVKIAAKNENILKHNILTAKLLNISLTPSFFLMTKDGCFVSNIEYIEEINSSSDFLKAISKYDSEAQRINELVQRSRTGSAEERLQAINELYDTTESIYRPFLMPFIDSAISLASKSGNLEQKSKYLMARTDTFSTQSFLNGNTSDAVENYVKLAGEKSLTAEYRQQAWYMAGYLLAMSESSQYDTIITYLQNAVNAAPDSKDAAAIQRAINEIGGR